MTMVTSFLFNILLLVLIPSGQSVIPTFPRIVDDLATHKDLHQFTQLIRDFDVLWNNLRNKDITILAPTDSAFEHYRGRIDVNLLLYHILPLAMNYKDLSEAEIKNKPLKSISESLPYLWPKTEADEFGRRLFINDALVLQNDSNHFSRSRGDIYGKLQIVHKINKVLSPMTIMSRSPTAYDFLSQTSSWPLISYSFNNFLKRVITTNSVSLYKESLEGTFLVPADEFRTTLDDLEITQNTIPCAISPSVIYSHNSLEQNKASYTIRTLNRDCVLIFTSNIIIVKDTLRDFTKILKILIGNIPLKNGVAYVVDKMPGVWKPQLPPKFPIRSLWSHINNDYFLQIATRIMENLTQVDIQNIRQDTPENFTIFLVRDYDWLRFFKKNDKTLDDFLNEEKLQLFTMRHISRGVYNTQRLLDVTKTSLRGETLTLGLDEEKIIVKFEVEEDETYIVWGTQRLKILQKDILCSNGMIHVIDKPFIFDSEIEAEDLSLWTLWRRLSNMMY